MSSTYWYNSGAWVEWSHANLSDYELYVAGPTSGYTSAKGVGQYYGCTTNGNALLRGAGWNMELVREHSRWISALHPPIPTLAVAFVVFVRGQSRIYNLKTGSRVSENFLLT